MSKISLKLEIAGRTYPISILESEQDRVKQAAADLNSAIELLKNQYSVNDLQDLVAMASLQLILKTNQMHKVTLNEIKDNLNSFEKEISTF